MKRSRILTAAVAALALAPTASASASRCVNVSQTPDAFAYASSTHSSGSYPVRGIANGVLESGASQGYWNDNTNGVWPDWVAIGWRGPRTISRVVVKIPTIQPGFPSGETTLGRVRVQYFDAATATYRDVVGAAGQDNPILDWSGPLTADGSETRTFDLATPVVASSVRVVVEEGSSDGWSWLAELETYDCTPQNLAAPLYDAVPFVSSERGANSYLGLTDGSPLGPVWMNDWPAPTPVPDYAGVEWRTVQQLDRVVLRGPIQAAPIPVSDRTFGQVRLQWWDAATLSWTDADVVGAGQTNPLRGWTLPTTDDGSQTRQFNFRAIRTTRVRALFEVGFRYGDVALEEFEAYLD